ncbi:hypothetical protein AAAC51_39675 [Priestia megaterium]
MNIQTHISGSKLALSFAQTSQREKIQNWMLRGLKSRKNMRRYLEKHF